MARYNKVGSVSTTISRGTLNVDGEVDHTEACMVCTYHETDVVKWNDKYIRLYTGGWFSNTTKVRMNQVSNQYGLDYSVYQAKGIWYVDYKGVTQQFVGAVVVITRNDKEN